MGENKCSRKIGRLSLTLLRLVLMVLRCDCCGYMMKNFANLRDNVFQVEHQDAFSSKSFEPLYLFPQNVFGYDYMK